MPGDFNRIIPENRTLIAARANPNRFADALFLLDRAGILTPENRTLIAAHANPNELASALSSLHRAGILTQENFTMTAAHDYPNRLSNALFLLHYDRILTQENFMMTAAHANLDSLLSALSALYRARVLTQNNFNTLMHPTHSALLTAQQFGQNIWNLIPDEQLTQANYERLVRASEDANPEQAIQRIVGGMMVNNHGLNGAAINPSQSTHTASVHQSVSASATTLKQQYSSDKHQLDATLTTIREYILSLDDTRKHSAAKRCIQRLTEDGYAFEDSTSKVSTLELLGLFWLAIHDESKRSGTLDDAKQMLIEALYEIQRGYNLDENGHDDGLADKPICTAGTFNKLMEKLNSIHRDVEVLFITKELASLKLPVAVKNHLKTYLQTESAKEHLDALKNSSEISDELWASIKDDIKAAMIDYKTVFANEDEFDAFINAGQDIAIQWDEIQAVRQTQVLANQGLFSSSSSSSSSSSVPLNNSQPFA